MVLKGAPAIRLRNLQRWLCLLVAGVAAIVMAGRSVTADQPWPEIPAHVLGRVGGVTGPVAVDGDLAVLAVGRGLVVLDVRADPPRTLGRVVDLGADPLMLALIGRRAYVVTKGPKLVVVDLTDIGAPRPRGQLSLVGEPLAMTASGDLVLVAVGNAGLEVVNTADPDRPTRLARILGPPDKGASAVAFLAGYAYVGQRGQLTVMDLADPGAPRVSARVSRGSSSVMALAVAGGVVAVSDWDRNNQNIDLYDRVSMAWRGRMAVNGKLRFMVPLGKGLIAGGTLWDQSYGGVVWQVDLTNPAAPRLVVGAQRNEALIATPYSIVGLAVGEGRAYVADPRAGLLLYDLSVAGRPSPLVGLPGLGVASDVAVTGDFALAVDPFIGLVVVDLAALGGPAIIATDPGARASDRVLVVGRRAFAWQAKRSAAYGTPSVSIYDLAAEGRWTAASRLSIQPDGLVALGDYLYLVTAGTLYTYDLSDTWQPVLKSRRDVPSSTGWLAAGDDWLFLLGQEDPTLLTYKLNLPDRPNKLGELNLEGFIYPTSALLLVDDRLYVQHNGATLAVVDVSVPEVPRELARANLDIKPVALVAGDRQLWGVRRGSTVVTLDVTKPELPTVTGVLLPSIAVRGLALAGDRLVLNAGTGGLFLVSLGAAPTATPRTSPTHPATPSPAHTPTPTPSDPATVVPTTASATASAMPRMPVVFLPISNR